MGSLHSGVLVRGDGYRPEPDGWERASCAGYFERIIDKLLASEQTMARISTSTVGGGCDAAGGVTHIDRLFGDRVEERRVCVRRAALSPLIHVLSASGVCPRVVRIPKA